VSLYQRIIAIPTGARALAAARLRREFLSILRDALAKSPISQADLARTLGVRKSAVNRVFRGDGNLRTTTLAEYLAELGIELRVTPVVLGTQEREREERIRVMHETFTYEMMIHASRSMSSMQTQPAPVEATDRNVHSRWTFTPPAEALS
jgi:transcriptional regulator with XRE-family HTH domain